MMENLLLKAVFATCLVIAGYVFYYFLSESAKISTRFSERYSFEQSEIYRFLFQKLTGFLFLGVIPFFLFFRFFALTKEGSFPGYFPEWKTDTLLAVLHLCVVILAFLSARKAEVHTVVPGMRLSSWKPVHVLVSLLGWGIYLLAYEYIFREILLFAWAEAAGIFPAIMVNVVIYAIFHLHKGKLETLGSIPFGIILCLISLNAGSFLPALMLHFTLAASTEVFSIYHNPAMYFNFKPAKDE